MNNYKKNTKPLYIGDCQVGGNSNISVQSMTKTPTSDVSKTLDQILSLHENGCDIIRCGVPDQESAIALKEARIRFKSGLGTKFDVLEAETQLSKDKQ